MTSSTQIPDGATTSNVVFQSDFTQGRFSLLELSKELEAYMQNSNAFSFEIRGLETDTAVLVTDKQSFSLQRSHTSNMLLPVAPLPQEEDDEDTSMEPKTETLAALDILDNTLTVIPIAPRLDRLSSLLSERMFEGWPQEPKLANAGNVYNWEHLQNVVQASDDEINNWLLENDACMINGYFRLFHPRFKYDLLQEILLALPVLDMEPNNIDGKTLADWIVGGENIEHSREVGMEGWMILHMLKSFNESSVEAIQKTKDGRYSLSTEKVCRSLGIRLLAEKGDYRWRLDDFKVKWKEIMRQQFGNPQVQYLAGECVVEPPDGGSNVEHIRYFPKANLPTEPSERFKALFKAKARWNAQEIRPFLRELVVDEKKLDILLLKHARGVKQPDGSTIYNSRTK